jgi:acyl dehydratase
VSASWDDLVEGARHDAREYGPLTRTDFVRYQGASGDFNPIHHDEEFAASAGFPSVFSVGMLQAGILGTYCTEWLGAENVRRFAVQFREQVWPGDHLECTATVARRYEDAGERRVDLDVLATRRESGAPAVVGTATFVVP